VTLNPIFKRDTPKTGEPNNFTLGTMNFAITPTSEPHFEGLRKVLDTVAREKRYLAFLQAPPAEEAFAFFRNIVANNLCQVVVLEEGAVVGWCDVLPTQCRSSANMMPNPSVNRTLTSNAGVFPPLRSGAGYFNR
jgi:hypothetical protein